MLSVDFDPTTITNHRWNSTKLTQADENVCPTPGWKYILICTAPAKTGKNKPYCACCHIVPQCIFGRSFGFVKWVISYSTNHSDGYWLLFRAICVTLTRGLDAKHWKNYNIPKWGFGNVMLGSSANPVTSFAELSVASRMPCRPSVLQILEHG